jgi:hypothetical protein
MHTRPTVYGNYNLALTPRGTIRSSVPLAEPNMGGPKWTYSWRRIGYRGPDLRLGLMYRPYRGQHLSE